MAQKHEASAGVFNLPTTFDKQKYAAHWVKKGNAVDAMKAPQPILGTNYGAEGWSVWQYPNGNLKGRPAEVTTEKSGVYVLMCRPRSVQDDVNAIYGNVSKQHLIKETTGQSIAGQEIADGGMLTDDMIRKATGITEFGGEDTPVLMNRIRNGVRVEPVPAAEAETAET